MKIVFFGSRHVHDIAWQLKNNFNLILLVTTEGGTAKFGAKEKIPFTQVLNINTKLTEEIKKLKPDLGIVADFGLIIPKALIDAFPLGILNVHPSFLPKYRGPTPVQTAILNGDKTTGISIFKLDEQIDHGPLIYQKEIEIPEDDYTDKLLTKLFNRAAEVLPDVIRSYSQNPTDLMSQDDKKATYTKILTKDDGYIDTENPPEKRKLLRMINALSPWPGVWTRFKLNDKELIIKLHPLGLVHVEGRRPMSYKDFANGYPRGKVFLQKLSLI